MSKKVLVLFTAILFTVSLVGVTGFFANAATLTGSFTNDLTLTPQTKPLHAYDSKLQMDYEFDGGMIFSSTSEFSLTGFEDQKFGLEGSISLLDFSSTLDFDPTSMNDPFDSWKGSLSLSAGGLSVSDTLVLKKLQPNDYGAGMELTVSGGTPKDVSVTAYNYFGMDSSENITNKSSLTYEMTKVVLSGLTLGECCEFSNTTYFGQKDAFDPKSVAVKSEFKTTIQSTNLPLTLDADLTFTPQTKSLQVDPALDLSWACFEVYTELQSTLGNDGPDISGSSISGLTVEGFSISDVEFGPVYFSSYTALHGHTVADLSGGFMGSYDYVTKNKSVELDEVIQVEFDDTLNLTLDTYFNMTESSSLFDLALINGDATYAMSDQFDLGMEMFLVPDLGMDKLTLEFDYYF